MNKLTAYFQLLLALLCACAGLATLVNLILISQRPETISVVNTIIGQGVMIIAFFALAKMLYSKAMARIKKVSAQEPDSSSPDQPA